MFIENRTILDILRWFTNFEMGDQHCIYNIYIYTYTCNHDGFNLAGGVNLQKDMEKNKL